VLIVAENLFDANGDGLVDVPDDQSNTGVLIVFDFAAIGPVTAHQLALIDIDHNDEPPIVTLFDPVGAPLASFVAPYTGDNGVIRLSLEATDDVAIVEIMLGGSGAIDDLIFEYPACRELTVNALGAPSTTLP
jgi:hypothetical protein